VQGAELLLNNTIETAILRGEGRAYGMEFYLRKNTGRFTGWLSYTLARSERRVPGITPLDPGINGGEWYPTNYDKTHDLSLTGIYEINNDWSVSSNFVFSSGRPVTYPSSRYEFSNLVIAQYENRNQQRLPAYHRLDISATLRNKLGGDWIFSIYNIYNRMNAASITFGQNEDTPIVTEAVKTSIFGIVPSITFNFNF
jgi:outer membrane receptor protein involved in Fe transport